MGLDTFYEVTKRSIPLLKNEAVSLTWRDSVISVKTERSIHFLEFSYNLECLDKVIDVVEFSLPSPKNSPATELCKSKFICCEMKNYDYTEMIIDSSFWPHNKSLAQEMTTVSMTAWSPPYFRDNKSVLAILNNVGGVEIVMQEQYKWISLLNLSPYIADNLEHNKSPKSFKDLKSSVYIVETSSVCWAPQLNSDHSAYFVTAQKNGAIFFWQIFNNMQAPIMKGKIQSNMYEIRNMLWISKTNTDFLLICADIVGQVNVFYISIKSDEFRLLAFHVLWQHKDRMIASNLNHTIVNGNVVILFSKHRHFVVQILDNNCKILSQYINNINDHRITDITSSIDGLHVAVINVKIFKINISYENDLKVELIPLDLKDTITVPTYELHSLCFSKNNIFCVLGIIDRKLLCRKEVFKIEVLFVSTESKFDSLIPSLVNNPEKKLTHYWDCIEALRYKINKMKRMPELDIEILYSEGANDIFKLKIYLLLLIFYTNMKKIARIPTEFTLPELSIDVVKEKILLLHAQSRMETLFKTYQNEGELKVKDEQSLFSCFKYLEFHAKKYKSELSLDDSTLSVVKKFNFEYVCQSCDDKIDEGFTCKNGHLNIYCMLSFLPIINDDYLVCKCCGSTANVDVNIKDRLCVFCDQWLFRPD